MSFLYASNIGVFIFLILLIGGGAAWMTGRAVAMTWRPLLMLAWFTVLLTAAMRFLSFGLFHEPLLSIHYFVVDYIVLGAIGYVGWRYMRTQQMSTQYVWLYEKTSPFSWRLKPGQKDQFSANG